MSNRINNLGELNKELQGLQPHIGRLGGRVFVKKGDKHTYTLNEIVRRVDALRKSSGQEMLKEICARIRELDDSGNKKLAKKNILIRILTYVRQFFGNLFYDREKVLKQLENQVLPGDLLFYREVHSKQDIKEFVSAFLHPYVTGQIREEDEPENRKPMMELLREKASEIESMTAEELEEEAFKAYLEVATLGLYVNRRSTRVIEADSPEFDILVEALLQAIPKDFPARNPQKEELRNQLAPVLDQVNEGRKKTVEEALDYPVEGDPNIRFEKMVVLRVKEAGNPRDLFL